MSKSGPSKPISEYPLVVAGGGGTGKTALVKQLILSHFLEEYDTTIEDSYRKQVVIDDSVCVLEVLDTAGQEEYTAMREQYMKSCEGIILVYSITSRQSFEEVKAFYNQILRVRDFVVANDGDVFPLCIVGNKADLVSDREVSTTEGFALAKEFCCDFVETSAKSRVNVDECFYDLVRSIRTRRTLRTMEASTGPYNDSQLTLDLYRFFQRQKPRELIRHLPIQEYVALTGQLVQAAKTNNERAVMKLLNMDVHPDDHSGPYGSAIYAAAAAGHLNIVELLLSRNAAMNARGPRGVTPLQVAAVEGHHEIVRLLLSKGVPVDERSRMHGTALLGAASRVRLEVVQVLLEYRADVNTTGGHEPYKKALHAAAVIGSVELAKILLSSGAEINARGPNGYTALEMACQHGKADIVRLLLERAAQPSTRSRGYAFELKTANDRGHYKVVKLLLEFGASDELVSDEAGKQTRSTSNTRPNDDQGGRPMVAENSASTNWPLPTLPPRNFSRKQGSALEHQIQAAPYNGDGRQQNSPTTMISAIEVGQPGFAPKMQSPRPPRFWRFWMSKTDLAIQR